MKIACDETSAHSPRPGAATEPGPLPGHARAGLGIGHAPEDRRPIADLTVEEGILVPALARRMVTTPLIPLVMQLDGPSRMPPASSSRAAIHPIC